MSVFSDFVEKTQASGPDSPEQTEVKARLAFALLENDGPVFAKVQGIEDLVNDLGEVTATAIEVIADKLKNEHESTTAALELISQIIDPKEGPIALEIKATQDAATETFAKADEKFEALFSAVDTIREGLKKQKTIQVALFELIGTRLDALEDDAPVETVSELLERLERLENEVNYLSKPVPVKSKTNKSKKVKKAESVAV